MDGDPQGRLRSHRTLEIDGCDATVSRATIVEFGKIKYTGELSPDRDPIDTLWHEKRREDRLRAMGFQIVRIVWSDLEDPRAVGAKIRAAFGRAKAMRLASV